MTINDTKAVKAYFRGNRRFGRTTQLVHKATGRVIIECMGVNSRQQLWKSYEYAIERGRMESQQ